MSTDTTTASPEGPVKLIKDNQELRDICCYLDDTRQKSKRLAQEWQSFGKYTATVLRSEVLEFETKISILQEKLEKLSQENAELRDLCLFLNQMSGTTGSSTGTSSPAPKLQSTQSGPYAVHAACVTEVNATLTADPPQYSGFTGEAKLADDKEDIEADDYEKEKKKCDPKSYVAQLEQRLERVEQEKLELIKSLSAAHILVSSTDESEDLPEPHTPDENEMEPPPNIKAFIEFISDDKDTDQSGNAKIAQQLSSDDVLKLSILVDISRRLDAYGNSTLLEPFEAAEVTALRSLVNVSWENLKNKHTKKKNSLSLKDSNKPHIKPTAAPSPTAPPPTAPPPTVPSPSNPITTTATTPQEGSNAGMVILRTEL